MNTGFLIIALEDRNDECQASEERDRIVASPNTSALRAGVITPKISHFVSGAYFHVDHQSQHHLLEDKAMDMRAKTIRTVLLREAIVGGKVSPSFFWVIFTLSFLYNS